MQQVRIYLGDDKYTMRQFPATWQNAKNQFSDFLTAFFGCSQMRYQKFVAKFEIYAKKWFKKRLELVNGRYN